MAACAAGAINAILPLVPAEASDLGWLRYAEDIHLRVHMSRLSEILQTLRNNFRGYGVEFLNDEWCNVYIYSGPSPTKAIEATV
jgi:hypothetical protein